MEETRFEEMDINDKTISALKKKDFKSATEVQIEAIPPAIEGKDLVVQARTGSGKTHAFLIPIFEKIEDKKGVKAIVLTPTRELAQQVEKEARQIAKEHRLHTLAIYGGASINVQIKQLPQTNFVAGTPGRVIDLIKRGHLKLNNIDFFILDEADRMLEMGFLEDITWIIRKTPKQRQTMLFSATMPSEIVRLAKKYMKDPVKLALSEDEISAKGISQYFISVGKLNKLATLSALLEQEPGKYLIFCNTKKWTQILTDKLRRLGYKAYAMHGDMSQSARTKTMNKFKAGKVDILVSTDVASRGIDVENITHVVNYDTPRYEKDYVHRIGRTGRLGKEGKAVTFVSKDEMEFLTRIEEYVERKIEELDINEEGRIRFKIDFTENADIYGMVPFRFSLKEKVGKWEIVKKLKEKGIREMEVGRIELDEEGGIVEVIYSKAHRMTSVDFFEDIELDERGTEEKRY